MTTLIVTLPLSPPGTATDYSYVLTPDGRTMAAHASAPAALLPQPGTSGAEVVAVVPVRALSWHRVELPKGSTGSTTRLRAVLDGLLEDRLLDEPESLHFALEPQAQAGTPAWVAVCDKAWLHAALQALEAAGHPVSRIVPEFAPDAGPAVLHALGEPQDAWLVSTSGEGVTRVPLAPPALALVQGLPEDTPVMAEPGVAALAEQLLQRQVTLRQAAQRSLEAAQAGWDLAQFDLASSGRTRALKQLTAGWNEWRHAPRWQAARWGAALLVGANLIGLNAWAWKENSALASKRDAVREVLTTTFPQVKVVVDAPVQMEREVAALRQATGAASGRDLEAMLGALSSAVPADRSASAIEFSAGETRLKGLGLSAEDISALAGKLQAQGYAARADGDSLVVRQETAP
ncbi:type II secretion system protein GspL [Variovorax terrae]|uniref:Type II secretion system protein GspL n=1 Tax=Variovorax terrae TaxID=2923278 RepID=A0A9X1VWY0_9BURK|nr:type II secretion system protein GspL [Variovorax terrae]MCJ0764937.1 type II secretion system protein GspL [Variovorax terrae]